MFSLNVKLMRSCLESLIGAIAVKVGKVVNSYGCTEVVCNYKITAKMKSLKVTNLESTSDKNVMHNYKEELSNCYS